MRKFTKTITFAAMTLLGATTIWAQEESAVGKFRVFENISYNKNSPNGEWLAYSQQGYVSIINLKTNEEYNYPPEDGEYGYYVLQTITDDGLAAGSVNNRPAYWTPEKEWTMLPIEEKETLGFCNAEHVYKDGSFILGDIDDKMGDLSYSFPVIWYFNQETNSYDSPVVLPYQKEDILGLQAQGMYIRGGITEDGSKFFGRFIDNSGANYYPVTWERKGEKEWEYKLHFVDQLVNTDMEAPVYPVSEKEYPNSYDWMSDEEKELFDNDMNAYKDSMQMYYDTGDMNYLPKYNPDLNKDSYFGEDQDAQDRYKEYLDAMDEYNKYMEEYNRKLQEYFAQYDLFFKDTTFAMSDLVMSDNGKYAVTRCMFTPNKREYYETPVLLDLENEEMHFVPRVFEDNPIAASVALSVLDDGTVFHYGPLMDINPETYVWKQGMEKSIKMEEWIKSKSQKAYDEITARMTLNGNINLMLVESRKEGNILRGYAFLSDYGELSWIADLKAYDDYISVRNTKNEPVITVWPNPATDIINVKADNVEYMQLFDLEGKSIRYINGANTMNVSDLGNGLYILKVKAGNTIGIRKINIAR